MFLRLALATVAAMFELAETISVALLPVTLPKLRRRLRALSPMRASWGAMCAAVLIIKGSKVPCTEVSG